MSASGTKKQEHQKIRQALRREILDRDSYQCQYCGAIPKDRSLLDIDHIIPRSLGGLDRCDNLVTACQRCNRQAQANPSAKPLTDHIKALIAGERIIVRDLRAITYAMDRIGFTPEMTASIRKFLRRGMTRAKIIKALKKSHDPNRLDHERYFYSICWSQIYGEER